MNEEIREKISEEVGKAIKASLPGFMDRLQTTILTVVEERINELKESLTQRRIRLKKRKLAPTTSSWRTSLRLRMERRIQLLVKDG
ncbi:hypothetical protein HanIR_Chr09g0411711 [Helianthus annuus]|nr:hypothetical protein HanIR_Chr09g0411711 [Helianthus annuus]